MRVLKLTSSHLKSNDTKNGTIGKCNHYGHHYTVWHASFTLRPYPERSYRAAYQASRPFACQPYLAHARASQCANTNNGLAHGIRLTHSTPAATWGIFCTPPTRISWGPHCHRNKASDAANTNPGSHQGGFTGS